MIPMTGLSLILERMKSAAGCREALEKGSGEVADLKFDPENICEDNFVERENFPLPVLVVSMVIVLANCYEPGIGCWIYTD